MRYSVEEARSIFGNDFVDRLMNEEFEATSRYIYPSYPHYGETEWRTDPIRVGNDMAFLYCYTTDEQDITNVTEDMCEVEVNENWYFEN
jgi:hypothetical protein